MLRCERKRFEPAHVTGETRVEIMCAKVDRVRTGVDRLDWEGRVVFLLRLFKLARVDGKGAPAFGVGICNSGFTFTYHHKYIHIYITRVIKTLYHSVYVTRGWEWCEEVSLKNIYIYIPFPSLVDSECLCSIH